MLQWEAARGWELRRLSNRVANLRLFGVGLAIVVPDGVDVVGRLPVAAFDADSAPEVEIELRAAAPDFLVLRDGEPVHRVAHIDQAVLLAVDEVEHAVAELSPLVFLHAGAAAVGRRAIVIPGQSRSGKSTLVRALLEAGATYFSDEYAILDANGLVYPYARPLSLRTGDATRPVRRAAASEFGAATGVEPAPVGAVLVSTYSDVGPYGFEVVPPGEAVLAMMDHAVAARRAPGVVLDALTAVAMTAPVLRGVRGEAEELARELMARPPWLRSS